MGLFAYSLVLSGVVMLFGYATNERIEQVVWHSLLDAEIDRLMDHRKHSPAYVSPRGGTIKGFVQSDGSTQNDGGNVVPPMLISFAPGFYNDVTLGERQVALLVRQVGSERVFMTVEIAEMERNQLSLFGWIGFWSFIALLGLVAVVYWLAGRLLRPVSSFATLVDRLQPDSTGHRIELADDAGHELEIIAAAMNRYLERIDGFVLRERRFVDSVSHELRTPIAVISGAADVLEARANLSAQARTTLKRIRQTLSDIEQLIAALLVLAKEPQRMKDASELCRLDEIVTQLVSDHQHLILGTALQIRMGALDPSPVDVPMRILQVAIANLLRNAIEHSDRGVIEVSVHPAGVVIIQDPGQRMTPEEIGRLYTATARASQPRAGRGIGLELIHRISEHLGWTLRLRAGSPQGTVAELDVRGTSQR